MIKVVEIINNLNDISNSVLKQELNKCDKLGNDPNVLFFLNEINRLLYIDCLENYEALDEKLIYLEQAFKTLLCNDEFEFVFSGSLSKCTYIDGYSDIDILLSIGEIDSIKYTPNDTLVLLLSKLHQIGIDDYVISEKENSLVGSFSNIKIELVPVVYSSNYLLFPNINGNEWKKIYPHKTYKKLFNGNSQREHMLSTLIRIFKLVLIKLYKLTLLKGYHIEILTLNSSRYNISFFINESIINGLESIRSNILYQIKDETQQFDFIDQYLGQSNSEERNNISLTINDVIMDFKKDCFKNLLLENHCYPINNLDS